MLKNCKLGTKLMGGFTLTALLILVVGLLSFWQQNKLRNDLSFIADQTSEGLQDCLIMQKTLYAGFAEVNTLLSPYLSAADRQNALQLLTAIREERAKTQEGFLAKPISKQVESEWKAYIQAAESTVKSNNQLIAYSKELVELDILNPYSMQHDLDTFEIELRTGRAKTADLVQKRIPFEGGTDDQATQLGKWLANVNTNNPTIKAAADTIRPLHKQFYQGIARIKDLVAQGDYTQGAQILDTQLKPLMQEMNKALSTADIPLRKAMENFRSMSSLQLNEGHANIQVLTKAINALVDKMNNIADSTAEHAVKSADTSKLITMICM
ncbi:MAG: hypothetical protein LBD10_04150, partial [Desulfobulbus sp.]|uniref:hypothetical protein n=1 Tax=Desulfobulbus sp. TaxID=895 RepID=UPI0028512ABE